MAETIQQWLQLRYATLFEKFGLKDFSLDQSAKMLDEKKEVAAVILSKLRKHGWIELRPDEKNYRKSIYRLKEPETVMINIALARGGIQNAQHNKNTESSF